MIILNEFIWRKDHYAFHITNTDAMVNICKQGLKPLSGERSKLVDDDIKDIFFLIVYLMCLTGLRYYMKQKIYMN